jgi:hypothetical protein
MAGWGAMPGCIMVPGCVIMPGWAAIVACGICMDCWLGIADAGCWFDMFIPRVVSTGVPRSFGAFTDPGWRTYLA